MIENDHYRQSVVSSHEVYLMIYLPAIKHPD